MFQPVASEKPTRLTGSPASFHACTMRSSIDISFSVGTSPVQLEPKQLLTFMPPSLAPLETAFSIIIGHDAICCACVRLVLRWANTSHISTRVEYSCAFGDSGGVNSAARSWPLSLSAV